MDETNKWLFQYHKKPDAAVRLICFHYAAGNASWFSTWEKYCGDDTELCAVQLPQRNRRRDEDMPDTIEELVEDFISDNQQLFDIPFIIFGHSMGAMIAWVKQSGFPRATGCLCEDEIRDRSRTSGGLCLRSTCVSGSTVYGAEHT